MGGRITIQLCRFFALYLVLILPGVSSITVVWQVGLSAIIGLLLLPAIFWLDPSSILYKLLNLFYILVTVSIFGVLIFVLTSDTDSAYLTILIIKFVEFVVNFLYFLASLGVIALLYQLRRIL